MKKHSQIILSTKKTDGNIFCILIPRNNLTDYFGGIYLLHSAFAFFGAWQMIRDPVSPTAALCILLVEILILFSKLVPGKLLVSRTVENNYSPAIHVKAEVVLNFGLISIFSLIAGRHYFAGAFFPTCILATSALAYIFAMREVVLTQAT